MLWFIKSLLVRARLPVGTRYSCCRFGVFFNFNKGMEPWRLTEVDQWIKKWIKIDGDPTESYSVCGSAVSILKMETSNKSAKLKIQPIETVSTE